MTEPMESPEDIIITRVIDGCVRADDLRQLSALAAVDSTIWDRLAEAHADRDALSLAVETRICVADQVATPPLADEARGGYRFVGWGGWTGWAAAAAVVFAWSMYGQMPAPRGPMNPTVPVALSADDALAQYIDASKAEDRFIRELPKVMVDSHPTADGTGTEITYLRQFVEKAIVNDLYELSTDEHGRTGAVRVSSPMGTKSTLY